jgi:hypothetical protein
MNFSLDSSTKFSLLALVHSKPQAEAIFEEPNTQSHAVAYLKRIDALAADHRLSPLRMRLSIAPPGRVYSRLPYLAGDMLAAYSFNGESSSNSFGPLSTHLAHSSPASE